MSFATPRREEIRDGIAVIGISGRFPGAPTVDAFWSNVCQARDCITSFSDAELRREGIRRSMIARPEYVKAAPVLEGIELFDATAFGYPPREAALMDPQQRLFLQCAWHAFEDAGYSPLKHRESVGVFAGTGGVISSYMLAVLERHPHLRGQSATFEHFGNDKDYLTTRAAYELDLRGPAVTVQTACSTSLVAVHLACQSLRSGECDMALAGGVQVRVPHRVGYLRSDGDVLSRDGHIRAFDETATGVNFGSGVGVVLLKPLDAAIADGDCIYAVIRATAINNDGGEKVSYTASSFGGQIRCIAEAIELSGIHPEQIGYLEAHGTGTAMGDGVEVSALTRAFRQWTARTQYCSIGSVKNNVGHLDSASGVTSLIKAVMALRERKLPPLANFGAPNPKIDFKASPFYLSPRLSSWETSAGEKRCAAVNSLGIGGTNAFAVLEEAPEPPRAVASATVPAPHVLTLSACTEAALSRWLAAYRDALEGGAPLASVCSTTALSRSLHAERIAIFARSKDDLRDKLARLDSGKDGVWRGRRTVDPKVALYFPDPASLAPGLEAIAERWKIFGAALAECGFTGGAHDPASLAWRLAALYALGRLWISWGVTPAAFDGDGAGLVAAAMLSGKMKPESAMGWASAHERGEGSLPHALAASPERRDLVIVVSAADSEGSEGWLERLTRAAGECWAAGVAIDWTGFYTPRPRGMQRVRLPTYPFEEQRHWLEPMRGAQSLAGERMLSPLAPDAITYRSRLSTSAFPFLEDHRFAGTPIVAASALIAMAMSAGEQEWNAQAFEFRETEFTEPLVLSDDDDTEVQLVFTPLRSGAEAEHDFRIFTPALDGKGVEWRSPFSGKMVASARADAVTAVVPIDEVRARCTREIERSDFYRRLERRMLAMGPSYRWLERSWVGEREALSEIRASATEDGSGFAGDYRPGLLDGVFQAIHALIPRDDVSYLLTGWKRLRVMRPCPRKAWLHTRLVGGGDGAPALVADVTLTDEAGRVALALEEVRLQKAPVALLRRLRQGRFANFLHRLEWTRLGDVAATPTAGTQGAQGGPASWILFTDRGGVGAKLAAHLERSGATVRSVDSTSLSGADVTDEAAHVRELERILEESKLSAEGGIVYLWGLDETPWRETTADTLASDHERSAAGLLHLVRALGDRATPLFVVTRGAMLTGTESTRFRISVAQGVIWGMGRTIQVEQAQRHCALIDLDPAVESSAGDVERLAGEVLAERHENQVALRGAERWGARLRPFAELGDVTRAEQVEHVKRRPPSAGEVEIEIACSAVTFRDHLVAQGFLDGDAPPGDAGAGKIVGVGPGVTSFAVGDAVVWVSPGSLVCDAHETTSRRSVSLGSHVTLPAAVVARAPESIPPESAAALPLAYVTARYALEELGRLEAGETVLIHAAATGVGLAAVFLAKSRGAEVIATASSPEKRDYLERLGVRYVFDSRTAAGARQALATLGRDSVDVLVGAPGRAWADGTALLKPNGRWVELGRDSVLGESDARRREVRLHDLIARRPDHVGEMLRSVVAAVDAGHLPPLPVRSFPHRDAEPALQAVARAGHLGVVVVSREPKAARIRPGGTVLLTGAFGGLGPVLIDWLCDAGADHLVLVDLRPPSGRALDAVARAKAKARSVEIATLDVADRDAVRSLVRTVDAKMPPLRAVFHCAAVIDDAPIAEQTWSRLERTLRCKVQGSWNLHVETLHEPLEAFVMFGSIAGLMGSPRQINYAAANAYQDSLAHYRRSHGLAGLSIDWSPWTVGVAANMGASALEVMRSWGSYQLDATRDLEVLGLLLEQSAPQVAVLAIDWTVFTRQYDRVPSLLQDLAHHQTGQSEVAAVRDDRPSPLVEELTAATSAEERRLILTRHVSATVVSVLGIDPARVAPGVPFIALGLDSLLGAHVTNALKRDLKRNLPPTICFTYPTVSKLADHLTAKWEGHGQNGKSGRGNGDGNRPTPEPKRTPPPEVRADRPVVAVLEAPDPHPHPPAAVLSNEQLEELLKQELDLL